MTLEEEIEQLKERVAELEAFVNARKAIKPSLYNSCKKAEAAVGSVEAGDTPQFY